MIFTVFSLTLFIILTPLSPSTILKVNFTCKKRELASAYCTFNCSFLTKEDMIGRAIVTHSGWAAIFDEEFEVAKNQAKFLEIQLPRRNYTYYLRGAFYSEEHYGTLEKTLRC